MLALILIPFFTFLAKVEAQEGFPQGCLADSANLEKTCQALSQVKNFDVLVFQSGEKMLGCHLTSKNTNETKSNEDYLSMEIQFFQSISRFIGILDEAEIIKIINNPREALNFEGLSAQDIKFIKNLDAEKSKRQALRSLRSYSNPQDQEELLKIAKQQSLDILKNDSSNLVNTVMQERVQRTVLLKNMQNSFITEKREASCLPDLNAFYLPERAEVPPGTPNFQSNATYMNQSFNYYPKLTQLYVMSHELAHSFDPCESGHYSQSEKKKHPDVQDNISEPFQALINCLRFEGGNFRTQRFKGKGCGDAHTREAFCDHIAVEVVAREIQKTNKKKDDVKIQLEPGEILLPPGFEFLIFHIDGACRERANNIQEKTHPLSQRRLQDILLKHPILADLSGCPKPTERCDIHAGATGPLNRPKTKVSPRFEGQQ